MKRDIGAVRRLSAAVLAAMASGSGYSGAVHAQEGGLEEVVVTGSRIRNQDGMTTPTPVTAVSVDELANFNPGTTIAEKLDALPQFFGTTTAQRGGNSISTTAGGSYLNLRGMGLNRTLVLLDGSRIIPADANGSVNIDNFPSALMQRVDVVTGGASAAYGADAVAGVVNFVLNREFQGLKLNASTGTSQEGEGDRWNFSLAGGTSFMEDRLHLVGSIEAREIDQIEATTEGIGNWKDWGYVNNPDWNASDPPGTNPRRITLPYVFPSNSAPQGLIISPDTFSLDNHVFLDDGSGVRPYVLGDAASTTAHSGGPEYLDHLAANNSGVDGNEAVQRSGLLSLQYDVSDDLVITATAMLGRTESHNRGQRSNFNFSGSTTYGTTIYRDNAYLPADVAAAMDADGIDSFIMSKVGFIRTPGAHNVYNNRHNFSIGELESYTLGFDYDINDNWTLTGHYQIGKSTVDTGIRNVPRIDKYFLAMDAIDDGNGNIVCRISQFNPSAQELADYVDGMLLPSAISVDGVPVDSPIGPLDPSECVPFNVMGNGNVDPAAIAWIEDAEKRHTRVLDQDFAELLISGEVYQGWGPGPVTMAAGLTWRDEVFTQSNEPSYGERGLINAPELGIQGMSPGFVGKGNRSLHPFSAIGVGRGESDVTEYFVEFNVPVFEFDSGQRLDTSFAYRSSDYSSTGRVPSWKVGTELQIVESLRWRYTRSHDVREPNFAERYLTSTGGGAVDDPVLDEFNNVLTRVSGGNLDLEAEEADTVTTGLVYQPRFAQGLQISVDWYEIDLKGAIANYGAQRLVDDCFITGDPTICALVQRSPTTNRIERIVDKFFNVGAAKNSGVDVEIQYSTETNFFSSLNETLSIRALAGRLAENSITSASGLTQDDVGSRDRAEYSGTLSANYRVGDFDMGLTGIYYGDTLINHNWIEGVDIDRNKIASQSIFNLNLSYGRPMRQGGEWRAGIAITNLFDRDPPIIPGGTGQVFTNSHDLFGRRFLLRMSVDF
ncbi:MAG: TonB-dependent receptor plug domain-containing protein [Gammaproteobacteria bacterium]|nr:TonB-dependent receptor plug domain-containing protein [Gammaproteobacteria bacterium]